VTLVSAAVLSFTPVRAAVPAGQPVDGIHCDSMEGSVLHIHQHLAIRDHGKAVPIPPDVGRPVVAQCLYWIHTHTPDGIIHIESPNFRSFTLSDFFDVWGEPLSRTGAAGAKLKKGEHVAIWVDGRPYAGDPRKIDLTNHLDVTIDVGPPYVKPAPFTEWNGN
jgi:hypothetical protein